MTKVINARPKNKEETKQEYIEFLKEKKYLTDELMQNSLVDIDMTTGKIQIQSNEELENIVNNINQVKEKRLKRVNIWVSDEFYNDISTLKEFYGEYSLSEIVVNFTAEYINFLKETDFWKELSYLKKIRDQRDSQFEKFIEFKKSK